MAERRVLVIEDDRDVLRVIKMSLELMAGWEVVTAATGREGLERAAERPDAILLDVMMPDMDGRATLRHLRAQEATREIPVVMLTARVQAADRARLEELGAVAVIAKPFDPATLHDQIAEALGWR